MAPASSSQILPPQSARRMSRSLFFYGTLIHPSVLARVIGRDAEELVTVSALLEEHSRHHVIGEDYPAVVKASLGAAILGRDLNKSEACVRGSLVSGLTDADVAFLDEFEGDEYTRTAVVLVPLNAPSSSKPTNGHSQTQRTRAEVYLWTAPASRLSKELWSYEDFLRDKAHKWVGDGAGSEYEEVDRRRAMGGNITPTGSRVAASGALAFGKSMAQKYWTFEEGWININHGSYGVPPVPVVEAFRALQDASNASPDRFIRITYMPKLVALRGRLAELVGCDRDDLVMSANATMGVNSILRSLTGVWEQGDKLLYISTTIYDACASTLQYVVDTHPHLGLSLLPIALEYPISHAALIATITRAIEAEEAKGVRVRLALIDAISSNPGVIVPWEALTKVFKSKGIISLVDGAHQIGQLPVNLRESAPDYWVSNCHKWLLGHRGCSVVYVAKHMQHLIHSIPTGHAYKIRTSSPTGCPSWVDEFEWNGTIDFSPLLSVDAALDFRALCGGEERITKYCHHLAVEGGEAVAKILGTEIMRNKEGEGELIANMVNVRLPIELPRTEDGGVDKVALSKQRDYLYFAQIKEHKTISPGFIHAGKWWIRLSAQIYNDLSDFEASGQVLKVVCDKIRRGELTIVE